jgi:hypothetical protein
MSRMQIPQIPMAFLYRLLAFRCTRTLMKLPAGDLGETPDPDPKKLNFFRRLGDYTLQLSEIGGSIFRPFPHEGSRKTV